jgi:tight adherence protein B
MDALVMAAIGAMLAVGLLATMFTLMGVRMFSGFGDRFSHAQQSAQHLVVWVVAGFAAAAVVWVWTNWPVGGLWAFAGVLSVPLLKGERPSAADEIVKVEAIATWTEQIRDTMNASAGLQQSLVATATNGPAAIQTEPCASSVSI